jgi:hypothetical protein
VIRGWETIRVHLDGGGYIAAAVMSRVPLTSMFKNCKGLPLGILLIPVTDFHRSLNLAITTIALQYRTILFVNDHCRSRDR